MGSVNNFSQERRRNRAESNSYLNETVGALDRRPSRVIGWQRCYLHQHPCRAAAQVPPFALHDRALTSGICAGSENNPSFGPSHQGTIIDASPSDSVQIFAIFNEPTSVLVEIRLVPLSQCHTRGGLVSVYPQIVARVGRFFCGDGWKALPPKWLPIAPRRELHSATKGQVK